MSALQLLALSALQLLALSALQLLASFGLFSDVNDVYELDVFLLKIMSIEAVYIPLYFPDYRSHFRVAFQ